MSKSRERRLWRLAFGAAAGILLAQARTSHALAQEVGGKFMLDPPEQSVGTELLAKNLEPLVSQHAWPERAVRLLSSVTTHGTKFGRSRAEVLPEGTLLYAASADGRIFCPIANKFYTRCLMDSEGRGSFDTGVNAESLTHRTDFLIYHKNGSVLPESIEEGLYPLEAAATYAEAPTSDIPRREIKIIWRRRIIGGGESGGITTIQLSMRFGDSIDHSIFTREIPIEIREGAKNQIEYNGAVIDLLGITPGGLLRYRIERPMPPGPRRFSVW